MENNKTSLTAEVILKLNRNTKNGWAQNDIILSEGEPALLLEDNGVTPVGIKYGDGVNKFSVLPLYSLKYDNSYSENNFAPVIKEKIEGNAPTACDASEYEQSLKVKLKRKNLLKYPFTSAFPQYFNNNSTRVLDNGDFGGVKVEGSIPANSTNRFILTEITLPQGSYTLGGAVTNIYFFFGSGSSNYITLAEESTVRIEAVISNYTSASVSGNIVAYPFVAEGSFSPSASDYAPYTDSLEGIQVKRYGKNLLDVATAPMYHFNPNTKSYDYERTKTGFKATFVQDHPSGTSLSHGYCLGTTEELRGKTITVTADYNTTTQGARQTIYVYAYGKREGYAGNAADIREKISLIERTNTNTFTVGNNITLPYVVVWFHLCAGAPSVVTGDTTEISNVQVEIGDTSTSYEEYKGCEVALSDKDGNVTGLTGITPNFTVFPTSVSVKAECEYNADTKLYIDKKINKLQGL